MDQDLSEKENTRENALESLKANFYCELCDKQYYKHQEFDNHINSYDHAHKQRLKDLKQREFSRNVSSKLRRNERKQKKYLQRLHKLADHKREITCAPGSGPMFKSTTVTVHDHVHGSLQSTIVHSAERENPQLTSIRNIHNNTNVASILLSGSESSQSDNQNLDNQIQKDNEHKISFSFAFPKKTPVKLEASAAVFYEFNEDISGGHGLKKRSRFVPGSFSVQSSLPIDATSCLNDDEKSIPASEKQSSRRRHAPQDATQKQMPETELTTFLSSDVCHLKVPLDCGVQAQPVNSDIFNNLKQTVGEHQADDGKLAVGCQESEAACMETTNSNVHVNQPVSDSDVPRRSNKPNENPIDNVSNIILSSNEDGRLMQKNEIPHKRPNETFHPVQSRDGSKVLQWPSEMIEYTCTQPSVSYSCNPLHFDFRSSKAIDHKNQQFCQGNNLPNQTKENYSNKVDNTKLKLNCASVIAEARKDTINTCHHIAKTPSNLKCYSVICSIKEDQKHSISKYLLGSDYDFEKRKSHRKCGAVQKGRRHRKCKLKGKVSRMSRFRHKKKCHINGNTQSDSKNVEEQHVGSKDLVCSLKKFTFSNQLPHAENDPTERKLLRRPTLQIKRECAVWNVDHKRGFSNQTENENSNNTGSINYQSKLLQLDHCSQNIAYSKTFCSWSSDKIGSNEKHESFLNHSCTFKRTCRSIIDEIEFSFKRPRLCKSLLSSQLFVFPEQNLTTLCKPIRITNAEAVNETTGNTSKNTCSKLSNNKSISYETEEILTQNCYDLEKESLRAKEFLKKIVKIKEVVENKLDQLCKSLLDLKHNNQAPFCSTAKNITHTAEKSILPTGTYSEQNGTFLPCGSNLAQQCTIQSASLSGQACNEPRKDSVQVKSQGRESHISTLKEADVNTKTYIAEQLLSHVSLPCQQTHLPSSYSKKLKYHQYGPALEPNVLPSKFKLIFPTGAFQTCATVYPVPLEPPFWSTSIATLQHSLPQHLAAPFLAASVDSVTFIGPQQQFLCPQTQCLSRTPYYQVTMEPSLCTRDTFTSSPPVPIMTNSVLCHIPVPIPHISHTTIFTPIHSQLPSLIPLHSIF